MILSPWHTHQNPIFNWYYTFDTHGQVLWHGCWCWYIHLYTRPTLVITWIEGNGVQWDNSYRCECMSRCTHALDSKSAEICTRNTSWSVPRSRTWNSGVLSGSVSVDIKTLRTCISSCRRNPLAHPPMLHHLKHTCLSPTLLLASFSFTSSPCYKQLGYVTFETTVLISNI